MQNTHKRHRSLRSHLEVTMLGILTITASFALGIQTAGDVDTIAPLQAESSVISGDMDGDQSITIQDAIIILTIVQEYEAATPEQIAADPNNDGRITVSDALEILHSLPSRP